MDTYRIAVQVDFYSQVHHLQIEASSKEEAINKATLIAEGWEQGNYEQISSDEIDKVLCIESTEVWEDDVRIVK